MKNRQVQSETETDYKADNVIEKEDGIIAQALDILSGRMYSGEKLTSSSATRDYLKLRLGQLEHEVFGMMLLTNQHQVIAINEIFRGTIDGAGVYPREVVKECLSHNAAAVIFYHNHPSGEPEPSQADIAITNKLKKALDTIEVRTLDHLVVTGNDVTSFAERGLI